MRKLYILLAKPDHDLVFKGRHSLPISPDLIKRVECAALTGEDVFGSLAPDEGLRLGVMLQQVAADPLGLNGPEQGQETICFRRYCGVGSVRIAKPDICPQQPRQLGVACRFLTSGIGHTIAQRSLSAFQSLASIGA